VYKLGPDRDLRPLFGRSPYEAISSFFHERASKGFNSAFAKMTASSPCGRKKRRFFQSQALHAQQAP